MTLMDADKKTEVTSNELRGENIHVLCPHPRLAPPPATHARRCAAKRRANPVCIRVDLRHPRLFFFFLRCLWLTADG